MVKLFGWLSCLEPWNLGNIFCNGNVLFLTDDKVLFSEKIIDLTCCVRLVPSSEIGVKLLQEFVLKRTKVNENNNASFCAPIKNRKLKLALEKMHNFSFSVLIKWLWHHKQQLKLHAYGLENTFQKLIYSYLKNGWYSGEIMTVFSSRTELLEGVSRDQFHILF